MYFQIALLVLVAVFGIFGASENNENSSFRYSDESYAHAVERHINWRNLDATPSDPTAYSAAQPLKDLDYSAMMSVDSYADVLLLFKRVRDERFIDSSQSPNFSRRSTWLYPMDGCWARAALASQRVGNWIGKRPSKLFVFGQLDVQTPYSQDGHARWWYHVVPVLRTKDQKVWVLDPAIDASRPLEVNDWYQTMGNPDKFTASICNPYSFGPNSKCLTSDALTEKFALPDQENFLKPEWDNLKDLNRNPEIDLGNTPPWANK